MAGACGVDLAVAVSLAGGVGSLPCAMLEAYTVAAQIESYRQQSDGPLNINFFCHKPADHDPQKEKEWRLHLAKYYHELEIDTGKPVGATNRKPFDQSMCEVVEAHRPEIVSFHFGLPAGDLLSRVKSTGAIVMSSATTVAEAKWLQQHGCDVIIAQGNEAGGHRGVFLGSSIYSQPGTFALIPQIVDAVSLPVVAAGGIADARGIVAAFVLGASAVQIGTAYLFTPQATITSMHRAALENATDDQTVLTNIFSGKPARSLINRSVREIGPISEKAPAFAMAGNALAPLKTAAESAGSADFSSLWSGQAAALCKNTGAGELTESLATDSLELMQSLSG